MSPLRGSVLCSINVLQKCHPYGVEEETGENLGEKPFPEEAAEVSGSKNFTPPRLC